MGHETASGGARVHRPRFVFWTAFLRQLPIQLFLTLWAGLFFGGLFSFFGVLRVALLKPHGTTGGEVLGAMLAAPAAIGTIIFFAVPVVTIGAKLLNYRNTRYTIAADRIDVEEGFWTVQSKRVLIADLREVTVRRGMLQRLSGVGSIYLASRTQGGGWGWRGSPLLGGTSLAGSGLMLTDLPEWREVFEAMQARLSADGDARRP